MKEKRTLIFCMVSFLSNIVLFITKLYIGLASNSISIYSDGINNFFDSLSGIISFVCLILILRSVDVSGKGIAKRCERLLSFIMSVIVGVSGFYFAYSSLERLMYPTPVTFAVKYLTVLIATALAKLGLFAVFRYAQKKTSSPIVKVMAFDSLLDFFITSVTALTLIMSAYGSYSLDAVCGIVISGIIIVSAVKMIFSEASKLIGYVSPQIRAEAEERILANETVEELDSISYVYDGDLPTAYIKLKLKPDVDCIKAKAELKTQLEELEIKVEII